MVDVTDETEPLCYLQGPDWRDARQSSIIENKKRSLLVSSESRGRWGDLFGFGMGWWIKKKAIEKVLISFLTSCRMVLLLEQSDLQSVCTCSWWRPSPCFSGQPLSDWIPVCLQKKVAVLKTTHFKAMAWNMKCDKEVKPGSVLVGVRMSESGNSSKCEVSSMLFISMGMAAGLSLNNRKITWSCTVYNNQVHYSWTA